VASGSEATDVFLAGAARTPIGSFLGSLADVSAPALAAASIRASLERAGVAPGQVDEVFAGNVLSAGAGQNIARQAAIAARIPPSVGATTINKVCGSGMKAVILAAQAIRCGDADLAVAAGTENMSAAPYLLPRARGGYRMGHGELVDSMIRDGLWEVYHDVHMGTCADRCAERCGIARARQDDYAVASYRRALEAQEAGLPAAEIAPVEVAGRKGTRVIDRDEEPGRFDEAKLRGLRPAFGPQGTVTAGNASGIADGAASLVVVSRQKAASLGIRPQARIAGYAGHAAEPEWFTLAPIEAMRSLLAKLAWRVEDVDLLEINEAFSVVPLAAMQELGLPHEKVNVRGGAVALGHPIGASGARILVTLLAAMEHRDARRGVAAICIGGGEALALALER